jgi:hypothetical protein
MGCTTLNISLLIRINPQPDSKCQVTAHHRSAKLCQ